MINDSFAKSEYFHNINFIKRALDVLINFIFQMVLVHISKLSDSNQAHFTWIDSLLKNL